MPAADRSTRIAVNMVKTVLVLYGLQLVLALVLHVKSYRHVEVDGISITLQMETPWYESIIPGIGVVLDVGDFLLDRDTGIIFRYGDWTYTAFSNDAGSIDWKEGLHTRRTDDRIILYAEGRDRPLISIPREGACIDL